MDESISDSLTNISIPQYYEGKSVFLTGGTGFIGKILVEKLLRGCPGIKRIYFLVRPKKGLSCTERLQKMFTLPLFAKLNELYPDATNKLIPIQGDIQHDNLGVSAEDRIILQDDVNILIHSAATVRFNEALRVAMEMNVIAVKEIIKLAKEIKNLEVFCHVSTAYSQCNRIANEIIDEKFYPVTIHPQKLIDAMSWMSDDMLNGLSKPLLDKFPNTYTFTKALAEYVLQHEAKDLPLVIIRPSIVTACIADPIEGWIDNYNGISGVIAAVGKGFLRTIPATNCKSDIVPADLVSNCIATSIWYHAVTKPSEPTICNCTSGNVNPTSFMSMEKICLDTLLEYPYNWIFRRPNFAFNVNRFMHNYWQVISHYIPAIVVDGLSILTGNKPRNTQQQLLLKSTEGYILASRVISLRVMNIYRTIDKNLNTLEFFMQNEWKWNNVQFNRILKAIPDEDREHFDFDMRKIEWSTFYRGITMGVKLYLIKDDMNELPKAKQLHRRYKLVRWLSSALFILLSGRFFFLKSDRFRKLWFEALYTIYRFLQIFRITSIHT